MHIGIDIGGTNLRILAGDDDGHALQEPMRSQTPASYPSLVELLGESLGDLRSKYGAPTSVGIGIPGVTTRCGPTWVPALPYLDGAPLGVDLQRAVSCTAIFANDAQCALVAEASHGAARGVNDVALIAVGTGIGGALMYDGRLVRGAHGVAGAFGWLCAAVTPDSRRNGPWESAASGSAMKRLAQRIGLSGEQLVDRARAGSAQARTVIDDYVEELGKGIAAIAGAFDPAVIVIAGGLSAAYDILRPGITRALETHSSPSGQDVRVVPAMLGADAGSLGALLVGMTG